MEISIVEKQIKPYIDSVHRGEGGAFDELVGVATKAPPQVLEYIESLATDGDKVCADVLEKLLAIALNPESEEFKDSDYVSKKKKLEDISMEDVTLNKKAHELENLKVNWKDDVGDQPLYVRLHLPSSDTKKNENGIKFWIKKIHYYGDNPMQSDVEIRTAGYYKNGEEILADKNGGTVFASGKYEASFVGDMEKRPMPKISRLLAKRIEVESVPINSAVIVKDIDDDGNGSKMIGKIEITVSRSSEKDGKEYPYDVEALYSEDLVGSALGMTTVDGDRYYILKWNLGNFKGTVLDASEEEQS